MNDKAGKTLFPLLLAGLAAAAFHAPLPVVVWLVILSVTTTLLAGLAIACMFLFSTLAASWRTNWSERGSGAVRAGH